MIPTRHLARPCCHQKTLLRVLLLMMVGFWSVAVVWAAETEDNLVDAVQRKMVVIPIRASGKVLRIQPPDRAFTSSKDVPLMRGHLFSLQSAVDHTDEDRR